MRQLNSACVLFLVAGCTFNAPVDLDVNDPNILINAEGAVGRAEVDVDIEPVGGPAGFTVPVVDSGTIVLEAGVHVGGLEITENDVVLVGEVDEDGNLLTTLDGDLVIRGNNVTVRGLIVTGEVVILGNNATLGFSDVSAVEVHGNNVVLHDNVFDFAPDVTGNNVVLEDNVIG